MENFIKEQHDLERGELVKEIQHAREMQKIKSNIKEISSKSEEIKARTLEMQKKRTEIENTCTIETIAKAETHGIMT